VGDSTTDRGNTDRPSTDRRPTVLLLDGHSLAYRAFYALPDTLATRTGQVTNAVYGFTSMLIKLLADRRPDAIAVAFDKGRDARRVSMYPEYKANRMSTPDVFRDQLGLIRDVLDVMGIRVVEVAAIEADDVLATIAFRAAASGWDAAIVTGDRDAMQLVDDHLTVLYTLRGITEVAEMTPAAVQDKYGVPPSKYVEYAALRGDTSDNLPGVPGVGDKTAAKLITEFGSIDGIYANLDKVAGKKVPAMLAEHEDQVRVNLSMMAALTDVDVPLAVEDLRPAEIDPVRVREVFGALEFRALLDRFFSDVLGEVEEAAAQAPAAVPERAEAGGIATWLATGVAGPIAIHLDTTDHVPHLRLVAISLAGAGRDPVSGRLEDLDQTDLVAVGRLLGDASLDVVVHDVKVLDHVAHDRGWSLAGVATDTELAAYLLNPEQRSFELDRLVLQHLSRSMVPTADGDDPTSGQLALGLEDDPWEERALAAQATLDLAVFLGDELASRGQAELLTTIELPLAPVLAGMERAGIAIDLHVLDEIRERLNARVADLQAEVWDHAGREFNIGSGKQLQEVLFEELGLPKTRRIKTGWTTDATALQSLADHHPIAEAISEWREVSKLLSTYVDALPRLVDPETGRIHTTLSQTVAATGRLSSSNPNLQNIPVRRAEGREIRRAFTVGAGFDHLLVADYSQIELRIMAHLSGDAGLLEAFESGEDIHATTAAKVFDLPLEDVDGALRDRAKAVNYGLAYGLTAFGLSQQLGIAPDEAQEIVDAYMVRFPGISAFLERAVEDARRDGWTSTLFGRRRYLPDLLSTNRQRRQMAERMALNAPIQGTAADVIKLAMIEVDRELAAANLRSRMILQVHDEVILEVPDAELEQATALVRRALGSVADLRVPLTVDTAVGPTWFDAQKH